MNEYCHVSHSVISLICIKILGGAHTLKKAVLPVPEPPSCCNYKSKFYLYVYRYKY